MAFLRKRDLFDLLPDSEGKFSISVFQGRRVIVDDGLPKVNGTNVPAYTTYLFAPGAIAAGFAALDANEAVEMTRNASHGFFWLNTSLLRWGEPKEVAPRLRRLVLAKNSSWRGEGVD